MKFLVLGSNGMAGHMISLYLKERGHEVFGFDRSAPRYVNGIAGDARNTEIIRDIIVNGKPVAKGEVVVVDENYGVRITEMLSRADIAFFMKS